MTSQYSQRFDSLIEQELQIYITRTNQITDNKIRNPRMISHTRVQTMYVQLSKGQQNIQSYGIFASNDYDDEHQQQQQVMLHH
jgi:hypothetical protein